MSIKAVCRLWILGAAVGIPGVGISGAPLLAQASATVTSQSGTVKAMTGNNLTLATSAGAQVAVTVLEGTRILQVAPGSTSLKSAQAIALTDISVGDKVLIKIKSDDIPNSFVAVMKSSAIAQKNAAEQADWRTRGMGGLVDTVDAGAGAITFTAGGKKIQAHTTGPTVFRRYAKDSIKFEDAKQGAIAQIQPGDQVTLRGAKSEDGMSIQAEEVVSGSFRNLSGTLATVSVAAGTVTLKDLATKKTMTVAITSNSDLRKLPAEAATRFAARQRGGAATDSQGAAEAQGGRRRAGMDLSRLLARLPNVTLADLHTGDAVMIVASGAEGDTATAVTLLAGVEPILTATPKGSEAMTLSPWSVGGDAPGGGGESQ